MLLLYAQRMQPQASHVLKKQQIIANSQVDAERHFYSAMENIQGLQKIQFPLKLLFFGVNYVFGIYSCRNYYREVAHQLNLHV